MKVFFTIIPLIVALLSLQIQADAVAKKTRQAEQELNKVTGSGNVKTAKSREGRRVKRMGKRLEKTTGLGGVFKKKKKAQENNEESTDDNN